MTELEKFNEGKEQCLRVRQYLRDIRNLSSLRHEWDIYTATGDALELTGDHFAKHFGESGLVKAREADAKAKDERLAVLESENVRLKAILADVREVVGKLETPKEFSNAALAEGWRSATVTAIKLLKWALGDKDRR